MYGFRARIGYTSPPAATEVFPYEFYLVAPKGVSLVITTLAIVAMDKQEIDQSYEISLRAAKDLARSHVDLVVLGGLPINTSRGFSNVDDLIREVSADIGKPVTTSVTAQIDALRKVGARRVAVAHPFSADHDRMYVENLENYGFEKSVIKSAGYAAVDMGVIPASVALALGRAALAEDPNADTLWISNPHWATAEAIDPLEKELGINVVTAHQAITWHALRRCKIDDKINGFGRLLRDF
jgi:maleate cis-trans isomerase